MSGGGSGQEKTEDATPRRLQQARKKGQVAKSSDLNSAISMGALLVALPALAGKLNVEFQNSFREAMTSLPTDASTGSMVRFIGKVGAGPGVVLIGVLVTVMVVGVAANLAQVGFLLSGEALKAQWERLNPASGMKRMFGKAALMEGLKAVVKTGLFGYLGYAGLMAHQDELTNLTWREPNLAMGIVGSALSTVATRIGVAWLVLAAIDVFFQRKQFAQQMRMTKDEVKQEFKETETRPEVKMAMSRMRRRLTKGRLADQVKTADVIVTNPTHFSVALKYEPGKMHAPQVVAKGRDLIALRIREIAKEQGIPIVPNPPLARQLYKKCEPGDFVPREMFQAVAEVLAFVYRTVRGLR